MRSVDEAVERRASTDGLTFGEAMRMLAGAGFTADELVAPVDVSWSETVAGPWLAETLAALHGPDGRLGVAPGRSLNGALRPYQLAGMQWLYLLTRLGLGACLADDMGLGSHLDMLRSRVPYATTTPAWRARAKKGVTTALSPLGPGSIRTSPVAALDTRAQ